MGVDYHAFGDWRVAGAYQGSGTFQLHNTYAASTNWSEFRPVAEGGDINSIRPGNLEYGHPLLCTDLRAVDSDIYINHDERHITPTCPSLSSLLSTPMLPRYT
jgi:hypothetical protein